jgi:3-hydroxyacyl-CoA dehydrogenase/enoyl-CoA hydratase/3-hydroxybutyryl-CoA epimerase
VSIDEPSPAIRWEQGADGVVVLTLDDPTQSANTMNDAYVRSMTATVARLEAERDGVTGVVLTSAKKTFFAGGDLHRMVQAGSHDAQRLTDLLDEVKGALRRLERLGRPVVAALAGSALGGGLEIALACHHRVALDDPATRFGFPEVTLGLLPGAGGVTRTVRMLGVTDALTKVLLDGRQYRPAEAKDLGLVDEVVATREELLAAARAWIAAHPAPSQPWDVTGFRIPGGTPSTPSLAATLPAFPATLRKRLKGAPMPAPRLILAAAVEGAQVDVDTALRIETRYLVELLRGPVSTNMITAFFLNMQEIAGGASRPKGVPERPARTAVVLGAGMMGAGIAYECARAGMEVVLTDVTVEAAARGRAYSEKVLAKAVSRGRSTPESAAAVLARIRPTAELADAAGADLVIEAVFEDPDLKRRMLADVEQLVAPDALVASNTSTLPITGLAEGLRRPADFIGLHFFSPVERMPLLEIVVGARTSDAALARAVDVARQLRKTPIVVNDSRGFFTSRIFGRFLDEAVALLAEGVHPQSVEQAALQAGYPTGPLALADEVSLALVQDIRRNHERAALAAGEQPPASPSKTVVDRMVDGLGRTGRAGRAGFYEYADDGTRLRLWPGLLTEFGATPAARTSDEATAGVPFTDLQERMLFAEALDAVRCLDEGVLRSVAEGNVGSLLGIGFPAWTGGVLQYVEQYAGGVGGFADRARELAQRYGERFTPPDSLVERAAREAAAGSAA